ncbi:MAG: potassium-transporting ATPase subunit KdpC [Oscillospiraceae bacterium]
MKEIKTVLPKALAFFLILAIVCGVLFPLAVTGFAQLFFKDKADGSIIEVNGTQYGSVLLGQEFTGDGYMWGRIMNIDTKSFTDENGNPQLYSVATNLSPASDEYKALVAARVAKIRAANPDKADEPIPVDLVTCSGSGLDPHISPAAAAYQIERIAKTRGIPTTQVEEIVVKYTEGRLFGVFGEKTVNVLKVNLALDGILQ